LAAAAGCGVSDDRRDLGEELRDMLTRRQTVKNTLRRSQRRVDAVMRDHHHY